MLHEARQQDFRCAAIVCCAFWADTTLGKSRGQGRLENVSESQEDGVVLGDVTTKQQRQWLLGDLVDECQTIAEEYDIEGKVTIDEERISNVLHWLHTHGIVTVEGNIVTPQNIEEVHRNRDVYIHLAMADHQHMWRSLAMITGDTDAEFDQRPRSSKASEKAS